LYLNYLSRYPTIFETNVNFVHGGGKDVTSIANKLGKEAKVHYIGVKRIIQTRKLLKSMMVMSGKINKSI